MHQATAPEVIDDEPGHEYDLHTQPEEIEISRCGGHHRDAEYDGERAAQAHQGEEPPLHDDEALAADWIGCRAVIHEEPRQVKKPGEPGDDEDDVERFEPEHSTWSSSSPGSPGFFTCRGSSCI